MPHGNMGREAAFCGTAEEVAEKLIVDAKCDHRS
jgi:hypothetical protein